MYATCIISWPISKVLDVILGEHKITRFNASQLGAIIKMHSERVLEEIHDHIETGDIGANRSIGLNKLQAKLIYGALNWRSHDATQVCKPLSNVFMLNVDRLLDDELIQEIQHKNYSRIPIYYGNPERNLIFGVLFTKSLIGIQIDGTKKISDFIMEGKIKLGVPMFIETKAPVEQVFQKF